MDAAAFPVVLELPGAPAELKAWMNGKPLAVAAAGAAPLMITITATDVVLGDANLLVIRWPECKANGGLVAVPKLRFLGKPVGDETDAPPPLSQPELAGRWQVRIGDDPSWSNMPLPAKFGAPTDIVFEPWRRP